MANIIFVTEQWNDREKDILSPNATLPLKVESVSGELIATVEAPTLGWTHEALEGAGCALTAVYGDIFREEGANASLGNQFVGSTEV